MRPKMSVTAGREFKSPGDNAIGAERHDDGERDAQESVAGARQENHTRQERHEATQDDHKRKGGAVGCRRNIDDPPGG